MATWAEVDHVPFFFSTKALRHEVVFLKQIGFVEIANVTTLSWVSLRHWF